MNYYSIHGNDRDGWTFNIYQYQLDKNGNETDSLSSYSNKREEFKTLKEILAKMEEKENESL